MFNTIDNEKFTKIKHIENIYIDRIYKPIKIHQNNFIITTVDSPII